jgi:hypothetical protein
MTRTGVFVTKEELEGVKAESATSGMWTSHDSRPILRHAGAFQ